MLARLMCHHVLPMSGVCWVFSATPLVRNETLDGRRVHRYLESVLLHHLIIDVVVDVVIVLLVLPLHNPSVLFLLCQTRRRQYVD